MKKMDLLGLSVVAAALILTGCSSDSDDTTPTASGPTAPAAVTTPVEMNQSNVQNSVALLDSTMNNMSVNAKIAAKHASVEAKMTTVKATVMAEGPVSNEYNCSVSGKYTETYEYVYLPPDGSGSWSDTYTDTVVYDNCVDNTSMMVDGVTLNLVTNTGSWSWGYSYGYNGDTNLSYDSNSYTDTYQNVYDTNLTEGDMTSRTYSYNSTGSWNSSADGEGMMTSVEAPAYYNSSSDKGTDSMTDTNSSGHEINGYRDDFDETYSFAMAQDNSHGEMNGDGFYAYYESNATGETLVYSEYLDNFTMTFADQGNESNSTIDGTIGDTCLGGSTTFATVVTVQENQADYWSDANMSGPDVLPHDGNLTLTGSTSATLGFWTYDQNRTQARVEAPDQNKTYKNWTELIGSSPCASTGL